MNPVTQEPLSNGLKYDRAVFILKFKELQKFHLEPLVLKYRQQLDTLGKFDYTNYNEYYHYNKLKSLVTKIKFLGSTNSETGCGLFFEAFPAKGHLILSKFTEHPKTKKTLDVFEPHELTPDKAEHTIKEFVSEIKNNFGMC